MDIKRLTNLGLIEQKYCNLSNGAYNLITLSNTDNMTEDFSKERYSG